MLLNEIEYADAQPIESYGADFFRIAGEKVSAPAIVHAEGAYHWAGLDDAEAILALKDRVDFILLGTGDQLMHAPAALRATLEAAGIGVEVMKTDSACRTYNVLVSEGRRVAAVLLPMAG
ncbi:Mth938-like domain-containing protein [Cognatishimia sp. SS12]|uniref:Mth938-like domain-containing protein n=1 Tax=Cognatishimia sp. SS12 TaxID=2979465 RepID=UPI00232F25F5|nr:Mth938-like domain-containing protein [Cognatishimia sp. SS12]MDC0738531.1 Mth938-like domain-containing protein [Cognatishimia sp. SS12]